MDIFERSLKALARVPGLEDWPEIPAMVHQRAAKSPRSWLLPVTACEAVDGQLEQVLPAVPAVGCLQISILLIDDMLDEDPRGEHQRSGHAAAANLAAAFQAAGLALIAGCGAQAERRAAALATLNEMVLATAIGQHLDVQNPADEADYWRMVRLKSGPYHAAGLKVGALLAGAAPQVGEQIWEFGCVYGELVQIHDDLKDALAVPANPDWTQGRLPLPLLYAHLVDYPERERFAELRANAADPEALAEAQSILIRCGAVAYCIDQLLRRSQTARACLDAMDIPNKWGLLGLLDEAVQPIQNLFQSLGTPEPVLPLAVPAETA